MNKPRDAVISEHVANAMRHTRLSFESYAQSVADHYHASVADTLRGIRFHPVPRTDPYAAMRANAQLVRRMVEGEAVRMPVEIEEALVLALPEPYQGACKRELAARMGLLAAELPKAQAQGQVQSIGGRLQRCGDSVNALAPMLADGLIDDTDVPHAAEALACLNHLMADITTLSTTIRAQTRGGAVHHLREA